MPRYARRLRRFSPAFHIAFASVGRQEGVSSRDSLREKDAKADIRNREGRSAAGSRKRKFSKSKWLSESCNSNIDAPAFRLAEEFHQQYLAKNPNGYCGIGGCGVPFKVAELQVGEKA